jgi:hypothetical protein
MKKNQLLLSLLLMLNYNVNSQVKAIDSTNIFKAELDRLIKKNNEKDYLITWYQGQVVDLSKASPAQLIAITAPYINSGITNAKNICLHLLGDPLIKKSITSEEKRKIVEVLCRNYLSNNAVQSVDNFLLR